MLVISTVCRSNQPASARCNSTVTSQLPKMAALILAKRCHGDFVRYFLFAGISKMEIFKGEHAEECDQNKNTVYQL